MQLELDQFTANATQVGKVIHVEAASCMLTRHGCKLTPYFSSLVFVVVVELRGRVLLATPCGALGVGIILQRELRWP